MASVPAYQRFLSPASPLELVAAKTVDRVAWTAFEEGKRNAYTAAAPAFTPVRLTNFMTDNGTDLSGIRISDDGSTVVFIRGTAPNRDGWVANPTADPDGPERAVWAARTAGGAGLARRPRRGQPGARARRQRDPLRQGRPDLPRPRVAPTRAASERDRGEKPFITQWGVQSGPKWSPDGRKIAFVSTRTDHSFIMVYDVATRTVKYMSPSVDFDTSPLWTADSKRVVFVRRPGLPFGQQAQQGGGGIGIPNGPAFQPNAEAGRGGRGRGNAAHRTMPAGRGGRPTSRPAPVANIPGLTQATFKGGYTLSVWKADVVDRRRGRGLAQPAERSPVHELRQPASGGRSPDRSVQRRRRWPGGGRGAPNPAPPQGPVDEWERYYSINLATPNAQPVLLTTTDGLIEDQTSVALSADGRTLYYCTNATDIERRHIWAVPVSGGQPRQVTTGEGIETYPAPLASGRTLATLSADWRTPQSLGLWPLGRRPGRARRRRSSSRRRSSGFPRDAHVKPELVLTKAPDGLEIKNQLFLPKDIKPGERRPAIVFVHGGPRARCCSAITTCSSTTGPTASISGSPTRATSSCR